VSLKSDLQARFRDCGREELLETKSENFGNENFAILSSSFTSRSALPATVGICHVLGEFGRSQSNFRCSLPCDEVREVEAALFFFASSLARLDTQRYDSRTPFIDLYDFSTT
jgi:hypothetical protein